MNHRDPRGVLAAAASLCFAAPAFSQIFVEGPGFQSIDPVSARFLVPGNTPASLLDVDQTGSPVYVDASAGVLRFGQSTAPLGLGTTIPVGLCFDRQGQLVVLDDQGELFFPTNGALVSIGTLPQPSQNDYDRLEAGPGGDVWGISRGQTEDRLFRVDLTAVSSPSFFGPFPGFGRVDDLCFGRVGSQPRQFVIGRDSEDLLILDEGVLVDGVDLGAFASGYQQVLCAAGEQVYCVGLDGTLVRVDPVARTAAFVPTPFPVSSAAIDAEGEVWLVGAFAQSSQSMLLPLGGPIGESLMVPSGSRIDRASVGYAATGLLADLDRDVDGVNDGDEMLVGSNVVDPQSRPALDLDFGPVARPSETVSVSVRGDSEPTVLAFSPLISSAPGLPLMGTSDLLVLGPIFATLPLQAPGQRPLTIPAGVPAGRLSVQAVQLTAGGTLRLSDAESIRWSAAQTFQIDEDFANVFGQDPIRSSGTWSGGSASASSLGGSGELGTFDPSVGVEVAPGVFEFDTDSTTFPAEKTATGAAITVTDGIYEFTDMFVPAGVTVRFRGSNPVVIRVSGDLFVEGRIDCAGDDLEAFFGVDQFTANRRLPVAGQAPGRPGPGGGAGGQGGDSGDGLGPDPAFDGQGGSPALIPAISGFSSGAAATPGAGSQLWPASGTASFPTNFNTFFNTISTWASSGGGGGAFVTGGGDGVYAPSPSSGTPASGIGPSASGGSPLGFRLPPAGVSSLEHFLVGGAGGGGGGSSIFGSRTNQVIPPLGQFTAGAAGAGGGGGLAIRAGGDLIVGPNGAIDVSGGSAGQQPFDIVRAAPADWPMPGGGGSGGSLLLQVGGLLVQAGELDIAGGAGGLTNFFLAPFVDESVLGGDGGIGLLRIESPSPLSLLEAGVVTGPAVLAPATVGTLTDSDDSALIMSRFVSLKGGVPLSYEVRGTANGQPFVFTDDGTGTPANQPGQPIRVFLQGQRTDPQGSLRVGPRRALASDLANDEASEARFVIVSDRSVATDTQVTSFRWNLQR